MKFRPFYFPKSLQAFRWPHFPRVPVISRFRVGNPVTTAQCYLWGLFHSPGMIFRLIGSGFLVEQKNRSNHGGNLDEISKTPKCQKLQGFFISCVSTFFLVSKSKVINQNKGATMENQAIPTTDSQNEKPANAQPAPISKLATAYAKAQGQFRTPALNRTAVIKNAAGQVLYTTDYADIQECIDCIKKPLSDNGLSFTQTTRPMNGHWFLILEMLHESGESKQTLLPIDVNKPPQQLGGLLTYLKRYQLSAFFGLAADFDDDGNAGTGDGKIVEGSAKGPAAAPKNNAPMQKALDKAPPKPHNHAPGASNPPPEPDLDAALGSPAMTTLEKIYAIVDERGWSPEVVKEKIKLCLGSVKSTKSFTPAEQDTFYKYLTMTSK